MFVFLLAVPALLVVVIGYVVGYGLCRWLGGLVDASAGTSLAASAEPVGWLTGLVLLAVVCTAVARRRRRTRGRSRRAPSVP